MSGKLKVMLTTEGTFPFHQGGVSTWCDILVNRLKDVDFVVYAVMMDPFVTQKFSLPKSAALIRMPLWGTEEPSEHLSTPFSQVYLAKKRTSDDKVREFFVPVFQELLDEILAEKKDPEHFADILFRMHIYFREYEYKLSFKSQDTWETFKTYILQYAAGHGWAQPDIYGLIQSLGWLYRFLNLLNTPVPRTHVTQSSAAAFCGIPCVLSKKLYGTPYLLTEHGVYLREQYLSLAKREYSSFLNTFLMRMIHSVVTLNYAFADQVSPVCAYNTRWERKFGIPPERLRVIYNGVDQRAFPEAPRVKQPVPTVVSVARIDPIKDILGLIRSAALVKEAIPEVKYKIFGSVSVPDYYQECLALRDSLGLQDAVEFMGHTSRMAAAYHAGDAVVLSSISEAFPYSVVEAMMTGKPVIATDVGGIREALGDSGMLVPPREPRALAEATIRLLQDPELRESLGEEARERALNLFTLQKVLEEHLKSYIKLAVRPEMAEHRRAAAASLPDRRVLVGRAYALIAYGFDEPAAELLRRAVRMKPLDPAVPVLLLELAAIYERTGQSDRARNERDKALAWMQVRPIGA